MVISVFIENFLMGAMRGFAPGPQRVKQNRVFHGRQALLRDVTCEENGAVGVSYRCSPQRDVTEIRLWSR